MSIITIPLSAVIVPTLDINRTLYENSKYPRAMPAHRKLELRVVAALIQHMSANGWRPVEVFDTEERTDVTDAKSAMELIFNLDDSYLTFAKDVTSANGATYRATHWTRLIGGNGRDILSDYSFARESRPDDFDAVISAFDPEVYE